MKSYFTLLKNEMKLNIRDMNMVLFAVFMPIVIFIILGLIYGTKPAFEDAGYTFMEQSFGAVCAVSICAGGLMGLPILISEYRERKILKRFQVTPISPAKLLFVELSIYVLYCIVSLISCAIVAGLFWDVRIIGNVWAFLGSWVLTMFSTFSIGMLVGGLAKNPKQASVIASVLYFPMLVFSGTTLPIEVMPEIMRKVMGIFPLTQGIALMKNTFLGISGDSTWLSIVVMTGVTVISAGAAVKFFKWES